MTFPTRESSHLRTVHGRHDVTVLVQQTPSCDHERQGTAASMNHEQTQKNGVLPWARKTAGNTSRANSQARALPQSTGTTGPRYTRNKEESVPLPRRSELHSQKICDAGSALIKGTGACTAA